MSGKIRAGERDLVIKDLSDKEKFQNQNFSLERMLCVTGSVGGGESDSKSRAEV